MAFHGFQDFEAHICSRASKILASIYEPLEGANEQDYTKGDDAVVWTS
jgi:hypothetical protein